MGKGGKGKGPGAWQTSAAYDAVLKSVTSARRSAGLSQRELAASLKKPQSWLGKIETKERRMDIVEFIAIARALGTTEADLLKTVASALPRRLDI